MTVVELVNEICCLKEPRQIIDIHAYGKILGDRGDVYLNAESKYLEIYSQNGDVVVEIELGETNPNTDISWWSLVKELGEYSAEQDVVFSLVGSGFDDDEIEHKVDVQTKADMFFHTIRDGKHLAEINF